MAYTIDDVRDRMLSLDQTREILATTEPLTTVALAAPAEVFRFRLEPGWNHTLNAADGLDRVDAYVSIGRREYQLTKDAALEATSACGLPRAYVLRTPAALIEPHLNYWYTDDHLRTKYKALTRDDTVLAVSKDSLLPFSNQRLVTEVLQGIEDKYGAGEVVVDRSKFQHTLRTTRLRLIIPEKQRVIERTGTDDDSWSVGIQVLNSLAGEHPTSIDGYLFRYWCRNGSIDTHASSGTWSRRAGQSDEVYEWARAAVDGVLGGLESSLDAVQVMADTSIQGETVDVLRDVFARYRVPVPQRTAIIDSMVDETNLSMYSVMQAVTAVANQAGVSPETADRLMTIGGHLPYAVSGRCDSCRQLLPIT